MPNDRRWYCMIDGEETGPYTRAQVAAMVASSKLNRWDLVKSGATQRWHGPTDFPELGRVPVASRPVATNSHAQFSRFMSVYFWAGIGFAVAVSPMIAVAYVMAALVRNERLARLAQHESEGLNRIQFVAIFGILIWSGVGFALLLSFAPLVFAPDAWYADTDRGRRWHRQFGLGMPLVLFRIVAAAVALLGAAVLGFVMMGIVSELSA